jgi:LruC domain-containing protein/uncharacterized repeat protein (TIGR01451 family)
MKIIIPWLVALGLVAVTSAQPAQAQHYRETYVANHFQIYAPPNNDLNNRYSAIVVTAMSGTSAAPCVVDLIDDAADGDSDDSVLGASLVQGQSIVRYIREGTVNDDRAGIADGDYFLIDSTLPVSVMIATDSDWQHDWAPAVDGEMRGTRFILYANGYTVSQRDVDAFAYDDGTRVELYDITATPLLSGTSTRSGITTITARPAMPVLSADLDEGEDLIHSRALGRDVLSAGRTYELVASRPVTVIFGAIASLVDASQAIDGAGYVPGRNGLAVDTDFYFQIPHNVSAPHQQELRIAAFEEGTDVLLRAWNPTTRTFDPLQSYGLPAMGHGDFVGGTARLYRLTASAPVAVFEASWFETGSPGTSDDSSFVPGQFTNAAGAHRFLTYLGPPGTQTGTREAGTYTHVHIYSRTGARGVTLVDADTNGTLFSRTVDVPALGYANVRVNTAEYANLKRTASGIRPYLRVEAPSPVSVEVTNWNDNWMAFAIATVVKNPFASIRGPETVTPGSRPTYTGEIRNDGTIGLREVSVRVTLPPGLAFVSASLGGVAPTSTTVLPSGQTDIAFTADSLAIAESLELLLTGSVTAAVGSAGEVVAVSLSATTGRGADLLSMSASTTSTVVLPDVAALSEIRAVAGDRRVDVSVSVSGVASNVEILRSTSATTAGSVIATRTHAAGDELITLVDTAVTNGTTYYYTVRAVAAGSSSVSTAGPASARPIDVTPPPAPTVNPVAGDRSATYYLGGSDAPDFTGYLVERRVSGAATWTVLNASPVLSTTVSDTGLVNGVLYEVRVRAADDDGNRSAYSAIRPFTPTNISTRTTSRVVYFEDLIGAGVNDWDYNDFIVQVTATEQSTSGSVTRVILDFDPLARGAGYVHRLFERIPANGAWTAFITRTLPGGGSSETVTGTGPVLIEVLHDTRDALPPTTGSYANTSLTQPSFMLGGNVRVVIDFTPGANVSLGNAPWDPYLVLPYIMGSNEVHLGTWGGVTEAADRRELDGWPLDFAYTTDATSPLWAPEGQPVWLAFGSFVNWRTTGGSPRWFETPNDATRIWRRER